MHTNITKITYENIPLRHVPTFVIYFVRYSSTPVFIVVAWKSMFATVASDTIGI